MGSKRPSNNCLVHFYIEFHILRKLHPAAEAHQDTKMSYSLQQLAEFLAPPEDYVKLCKKVADELFCLLQKKSRSKAARCKIVGGLAKQTSTSVKMDADLVVFVNVDPGNILETKKKVLDEWLNIIIQNTDLEEINIKKSPFSVKFELKNVKVDLLVAINFDKNPKIQQELVMEQIEASPDSFKASGQMSSELTELAIEFLEKKSKFCHDLARLAKFWSQTILITEFVSGKSTIMETMAVKAAMQEESRRPGNPDYWAAFKNFLEMVSDISNINLVFDDHYIVSEVPSSVIQVPLILDPTNPYNNFLSTNQGLTIYGDNNVTNYGNFLTLFSNCAKNTLSILENNSFSLIFRPQPVLWKSAIFKVVVPQDYRVSCEDSPDLMPTLKIRSFLSPKVKHVLDTLLSVYTCVVKSAEGDSPDLSENEMMEKVKEAVVKINWNTTWRGSIGGPHDKRAVSLFVPLNFGKHGVKLKQGRAMCISFNIKVVE